MNIRHVGVIEKEAPKKGNVVALVAGVVGWTAFGAVATGFTARVMWELVKAGWGLLN